MGGAQGTAVDEDEDGGNEATPTPSHSYRQLELLSPVNEEMMKELSSINPDDEVTALERAVEKLVNRSEAWAVVGSEHTRLDRLTREFKEEHFGRSFVPSPSPTSSPEQGQVQVQGDHSHSGSGIGLGLGRIRGEHSSTSSRYMSSPPSPSSHGFDLPSPV